MSSTQHGHDGNQVGYVDLLLTLAHLQVLLLILINHGGLSIVTFPVISMASATLKVSELSYRLRDNHIHRKVKETSSSKISTLGIQGCWIHPPQSLYYGYSPKLSHLLGDPLVLFALLSVSLLFPLFSQ